MLEANKHFWSKFWFGIVIEKDQKDPPLSVCRLLFFIPVQIPPFVSPSVSQERPQPSSQGQVHLHDNLLPTGSGISPKPRQWGESSSVLFYCLGFFYCYFKVSCCAPTVGFGRSSAFLKSLSEPVSAVGLFLSGARTLPTCSGRKQQQQDRRRPFPLQPCLL